MKRSRCKVFQPFAIDTLQLKGLTILKDLLNTSFCSKVVLGQWTRAFNSNAVHEANFRLRPATNYGHPNKIKEKSRPVYAFFRKFFIEKNCLSNFKAMAKFRKVATQLVGNSGSTLFACLIRERSDVKFRKSALRLVV